MNFLKILAAVTTSALLATTACADEARDLMEQVDDNSRMTSESAFIKMQLSTCKFSVADGKIRCTEKPRIKVLETAQMNTGPDKKDSKSIAIVLEPAAERGIGMLSYIYDDSDKDNETWLYLSALGKVKRMASGNSNDEDTESTSLFGSEITTEDRETGKLDDYTYSILQKGDYQGRPVAIVQQVPIPKRAAVSDYAKTISWIDTERLITLKAQMYDKNDKAVKRMQVSQVEEINGVWMARSLTVMNLVTNRLTNMSMDAISFDVAIDEAFLSQRALTDAAFREKHLDVLRAQTQ